MLEGGSPMTVMLTLLGSLLAVVVVALVFGPDKPDLWGE